MQLCSNCGHQNRAGVVFCENCGASLIGKMPLDTKSLDSSSEEEKVHIGIDVSVLTDVKVQGLVTFHDGDTLRLDIDGSPEPIVFKPKPETIFGRRDPATGAMPDVDLTPFAGYRMGVSRRHAAIRFGDDNNLDIWDLGSSNGTFLNGQRLSAHRPYRLRDGDELRLGQMMVRIYFDVAPKSAETAASVESTPSAAPALSADRAASEAASQPPAQPAPSAAPVTDAAPATREVVPQPPAQPAPSAAPVTGAAPATREVVPQPPAQPAPSAAPAASAAVPPSPAAPTPSAAPVAGEAVPQPPAQPVPSVVPATSEAEPQQPAKQPDKVPSDSTIAIQPSAIEAASVATSPSTLPPSPPITAPLPSPKPVAAPDKPEFPAGQTNSAALVKPDEPKETTAASSEEAKPSESSKPPENEEKRD